MLDGFSELCEECVNIISTDYDILVIGDALFYMANNDNETVRNVFFLLTTNIVSTLYRSICYITSLKC